MSARDKTKRSLSEQEIDEIVVAQASDEVVPLDH